MTVVHAGAPLCWVPTSPKDGNKCTVLVCSSCCRYFQGRGLGDPRLSPLMILIDVAKSHGALWKGDVGLVQVIRWGGRYPDPFCLLFLIHFLSAPTHFVSRENKGREALCAPWVNTWICLVVSHGGSMWGMFHQGNGLLPNASMGEGAQDSMCVSLIRDVRVQRCYGS